MIGDEPSTVVGVGRDAVDDPGSAQRRLALRIVWHRDVERVGELGILGADRSDLSRKSPVFDPATDVDYEMLAALLNDRRRVLRFTPKPGDIVIFDNRRVLHAREPVGGPNQRQHHRMWLGEIHSELRGKVLLGVRGLPLDALLAVQTANRVAA